ncbi:MAG TPA: hypothetical protein VED01_17520 [Burkholderiales bacterium]|nr:hypothetical protein [Burkholderiales bacterium]
MELSRERSMERTGLLYPMMVIAAIAVIVFSILGIATVMGWLPSGLIGRAQAAVTQSQEFDTAHSDVTFGCTECGVIESMRELEQG